MKIVPPDGQLLVAFNSKGVVTHEPATLQSPDVAQCTASHLADLGKMQFQPVGICIYCGASEDLQREHVIPFGLSGTAVLPAASCRTCAKVTSNFELRVLRGSMRDVRVFRRLRSRSRHVDARLTQRLRIRRNGVLETVELPLEQYPILLHFPTFSMPGILSGHDGSGIQMMGIATLQFGTHPQELGKRLEAQELVFDAPPDDSIAFAKLIGKIGYAMAVAQGALNVAERRPEIVASLLGELDEIGRWVGTLPAPFQKYPDGTLHRIAVKSEPSKGIVTVEIQLFADSAAPTYIVVLR